MGTQGRAVPLDAAQVLEAVGSLVGSDPRGPRPHPPCTRLAVELPHLPAIRRDSFG